MNETRLPQLLSRREFLLSPGLGAVAGMAAVLSSQQPGPVDASSPQITVLDAGCAISDQVFGLQNVKCFGAVGDGSTNDREAFQAAVAAAISKNQVLYIPPGTYYIGFTATDNAIPISGNLHIVGAGREVSRLLFGPEATAFPFNGFSVTGTNGVKVSFEHLWLQGPTTLEYPTTWDGQHSGRDNPATYAIYWNGQTAPGGELRLSNVKISANFFTALFVASGAATAGTFVDLRDCDLEGYTGAVYCYTNEGITDQRLHAHNTYFRRGGIRDDRPNDPFYGHLLYIHPNISLNLDGCRFGETYQYALQHYSGSAITKTEPRYVHITHCTIEDGAWSGGRILTSDLGLTQITGCTFRQGGIEARNRIVVANCLFELKSSGITAASTLSAIIEGCYFLRTQEANSIDTSANNSTWYIANCRFEATAPYPTWQARKAYAVGDYVVPTDLHGNSHYFLCTVAGVSGSTEPTWPTGSGQTVIDGTVTWTEQGILTAPYNFISNTSSASPVVQIENCSFRTLYLSTGNMSYAILP